MTRLNWSNKGVQLIGISSWDCHRQKSEWEWAADTDEFLIAESLKSTHSHVGLVVLTTTNHIWLSSWGDCEESWLKSLLQFEQTIARAIQAHPEISIPAITVVPSVIQSCRRTEINNFILYSNATFWNANAECQIGGEEQSNQRKKRSSECKVFAMIHKFEMKC
jgi:hypothetical protein